MRPLCMILVLLCQTCHGKGDVKKTTAIIQDSGVIRAEVGSNVTLECFCQDDGVTFFSWYQQSLEGKLQVISMRMNHNTEGDISPTFRDRFRVSGVNAKPGSNHLTIKDLRLSDSATYFCGILEFNAFEFGQGALLHVRSSLASVQAVVRQPAMEPLRPGESLNLTCTVHTESQCAGNQSLYWIKHGASRPVIMNPSSQECTSLSDVMNCTIQLAKPCASSSDAGIYYCALASCGEIVLGDGTRVETEVSPLLVCGLSAALLVSLNPLVILAIVTHRLRKKLCSVCKGTVSHLTCSAAMSHEAADLYYAPLSVKRHSRQDRQGDNMETVCVYSRVNKRQ